MFGILASINLDAANFLEISTKYVFTASNTNIIKKLGERRKKKLKQILSKKYSFRFQTFNLHN